MADPFSVDLPTLIVQADSCAAQIAHTPHLVAAAHPVDPMAARTRLVAAARHADDRLTDRVLAQGDLDRARRQATAIVTEVNQWCSRLLSDLNVLADEGPPWSSDVRTIRAALNFRRERFAGTRASLAAALPELAGRAAALGVVCGTPPPAAVKVIAALRMAPDLVQQMGTIEEALRVSEAGRRVVVQAVKAARLALQAELRRVVHMWDAAQKVEGGSTLPALDLTWVRGAVGRRTRGDDTPPDGDC